MPCSIDVKKLTKSFGEITVDTLPESPEIMIAFREKVNDLIKKAN